MSDRPDLLLSLGIALAGTAATSFLFYPGYLNGDSAWQYQQALSGIYSDMHPVIMAWVWSYLDRLVEGSGGMFLFGALLFWVGLVLSAQHFVRPAPVLLAVSLAVGFSPPVLAMLSQIHKDVGMTGALLVGFALLLFADRRRSLGCLIASAIALFYALAVRLNGGAAILPFTIWMAYLLGRDHLPAGIGLQRVSRAAVAGVLALGVLVGASLLATAAILGSRGQHVAYHQFLLAYDLAGISVRSQRDYLPKIFLDPPLAFREVEALYHDQTTFFLYWGDGDRRDLGPVSGADLAELEAAWWNAVRREPVAYLGHRARVFAAHLGLVADSPWRTFEFDVRSFEYRGPTVFGMPHNEGILGLLRYLRGSFFFDPWIYLVLISASTIVAIVSPNENRHLVLILTASAALIVLPLALIGVSAEFRYSFWPVVVALLQPVLLIWGSRDA